MQDAICVVVVSLVLMGSIGTGIGTETALGEAASGQDEPLVASAEGERSDSSSRRTDIIKSIEFEGNRKFKDEVLRQRLGFELGDRLDPFLAEGGRLTIADVYRKIGFAFVEVSLDRDRLPEGHLRYAIDEGPHVRIASVHFVGNDTIGSGTLKQVVKSKTRKWLLLSVPYTEDAIEEDLDRLRGFYYDHGYLDYTITSETKFTADQAAVRITFVIDEGPLYRVGSIVLAGNAHFTDQQLRAQMELKEGQVYLKPTADREARNLVRLYHEHGFVDADVRQGPRFTPRAGDNLVTVEFQITEGKRFRIGRIDVTGNEKTQDKVVRRVLDERGFTPGEWYNARIAPKQGGGLLERYVQQAASAQEVLIRPVESPGGDPNRKDVSVNMKEGGAGFVSPGVGISSDSGVIGRLVLVYHNFDLTDWPESLGEFLSMEGFRGAGQTLSLALEPGTRYSQYSINFVDPYWRDRPTTLNVLGRGWEWRRESHDEGRLIGSVGFEQRLQGRWRRSIGFRAERVKVDNLDFDAPQEIRDVGGDNQLYGVRLGIGETDVDDLYTPGRGHKVDARYEQVAGDHTFGKLEGDYVRYITLREDVLGRKTVLAGKLLGGTILGDAPPFEKFYGGGTGHYGLRGFEYRGVSPRGLQTHVDPPERKDAIGSDWIFLANAEITVPLGDENFALLFFVDSGTVDTGSYRLSIGTGIQIMVPQLFGNIPMRFQIATPLLKDDRDETQAFSFSGAGIWR